MSLLVLLLLLQSAPEKRIPPPGVELKAADLEEARKLAAELGSALDALRTPAALERPLLDVRVLEAAFRDADRHREFMDPKDGPAARDVLRLGLQRARELASGQASWTGLPGLHPLAYRSRIDDSLQPYGVVVPPGYKAGDGKPWRLDLWLHGRDEKLTQLRFLHQRMKSAGEFTPPDAIVLHLYGRFCNAFKFAGEVDVFEALEDVQRRYRIDADRIVLRGFSMGGAGAWHLGVHHAGTWAAVAPGAGFAETARYANVAKDPVPPAPWVKTLWHWYDATDYAANLFNTGVVAYSGELDKQKQAADVMAEAMRAEGLDLAHVIGPKTEHKYEPEAKKEVSRLVDAWAAKGRNADPDEIRFTTWTLRYPRMKWLEVEGLQRHWERATVTAKRGGDVLDVATKNVDALALRPGKAPAKLRIDGQELPYTVQVHQEAGRWVGGPPAPGLRKAPGLQGPIDDAFLDRFVFVGPDGPPFHAGTGEWVLQEMNRAEEAWRSFFRGQVLKTADESRIRSSNLVLWGDPSSNSLIREILPRLPILWTASELRIAGKVYAADRHLPALIYPNPLNPKRYVVLNSGFTFAAQAPQSNSRHVPQLPDWAVLEGPSRKVVQAGFFNEAWTFP